MLDIDDINNLIAEEKQYREWERAKKNQILAIHDTTRKQEEWRKHFGTKQEPDDSYLRGKIF